MSLFISACGKINRPFSRYMEKTAMNLNEIMQSLYFRKETYFIDIFGKIKHNRTTLYADRNNCHSIEHIEHWLSLNDLLNTSVFLNGDWHPDWKNQEEKYIICIEAGKPAVKAVQEPCHFVYFKSEELARKAIDILGEEAIKDRGAE